MIETIAPIVDVNGNPISSETKEEPLEYPTFEIDKKNEILNQKTEFFDFSNPPTDPYELGQTLIRTMIKYGGLGLSANQCGLPYRAFVMRTIPFIVVFNPRIVDTSSEEIFLEEGCLSFPYLLVKVKRSRDVRVRFTDSYGQTSTQKFTGLTARIFQHEADHLDGITFIERATKFHLTDAYRKKKHLERKFKSKKFIPFKPLDTMLIKNVIADINKQAELIKNEIADINKQAEKAQAEREAVNETPKE